MCSFSICLAVVEVLCMEAYRDYWNYLSMLYKTWEPASLVPRLYHVQAECSLGDLST